jgi:hypothetical protein
MPYIAELAQQRSVDFENIVDEDHCGGGSQGTRDIGPCPGQRLLLAHMSGRRGRCRHVASFHRHCCIQELEDGEL